MDITSIIEKIYSMQSSTDPEMIQLSKVLRESIRGWNFQVGDKNYSFNTKVPQWYIRERIIRDYGNRQHKKND